MTMKPMEILKIPRCGAKTRSGKPCRRYAMKNGRCRMHGGLSTGPKTKEGLERSRKANFKHGHYSQEAKNEGKLLKALLRECQRTIEKF